jgi:hypothetical protein
MPFTAGLKWARRAIMAVTDWTRAAPTVAGHFQMRVGASGGAMGVRDVTVHIVNGVATVVNVHGLHPTPPPRACSSFDGVEWRGPLTP